MVSSRNKNTTSSTLDICSCSMLEEGGPDTVPVNGITPARNENTFSQRQYRKDDDSKTGSGPRHPTDPDQVRRFLALQPQMAQKKWMRHPLFPHRLQNSSVWHPLLFISSVKILSTYTINSAPYGKQLHVTCIFFYILLQ